MATQEERDRAKAKEEKAKKAEADRKAEEEAKASAEQREKDSAAAAEHDVEEARLKAENKMDWDAEAGSRAGDEVHESMRDPEASQNIGIRDYPLDQFHQIVEGAPVEPEIGQDRAVVVAPAGDHRMMVPASEVSKYEGLGFTVEQSPSDLNPNGTLTGHAPEKYVRQYQEELKARAALVDLLTGR